MPEKPSQIEGEQPLSRNNLLQGMANGLCQLYAEAVAAEAPDAEPITPPRQADNLIIDQPPSSRTYFVR